MRSWVQIPAAPPTYVRKSTSFFSLILSFFPQRLLYTVSVHVLAKYLQAGALRLKVDALYGQFERLAAANERLTDMMLGRVSGFGGTRLSCGC
jgi:hypothetical protein